jgi:nucleotide-binding universal stress UspA family protein
MSIKTILVYLPPEKNAAVILEQALKITGARNAHVIGLHLIPDLPIYGEFPAKVSEEVIERLEKVGRDAATAAKRVFEDMMKASPATHEWRCLTGEVILSTLLDEGCDLLVMGAYSHSKQSSQKHALGLDPGVAFPVLRKNTERAFIVSGRRSLCEDKGI